MNKDSTPLIKISSSLLQKCTPLFFSQGETILSALDMIDTDTQDSEHRVVILSTAAFYKYRNAEKEPALESSYSIISLTKVFYKEPDDLRLEFGSSFFKLQSQDAFNFANIILRHHALVFFKITNSDLVVESQPENVITYKQLTKRPASLLATRFTVFANHYKNQFSIQNVKFIREWDKLPNGVITLEGNLERMTSTLSITHAMGWDPNLHTLNMKNFMPDNAHTFISEVVNCSIFLRDLNISGYRAPCSGEYNFIGGNTCRMESINLSGNHPSVVMSLFHGLTSFDGHIYNISITGCSLSAKDTALVINCLGKYPCFQHLKTIVFDGVSFEDVTTDALSNVLKKTPFLNDIKLYSIDNDISPHVSLLLHHPSMSHIDIQKSRLLGSVSTEKASPSLCYINIKDCEITVQTFTNIAATILVDSRSKPVVLSLQSFNRSLTSSDFLKNLINLKPKSNLIEFDWRQNPLALADVQFLIEFLKTQETLEFLNLRGCIRKHLASSLPLLADYVSHSSLTGIDFSADHLRGSPQYYIDFLNGLMNAKRLHSIALINMKIGDGGTSAILKLAQALPSLEEVSLDNIDISTKSVFISMYSQLMDVPSIRSIQTPKKDFERLELASDSTTQAKKIVVALKRMSSPKTFIQRLVIYERDGFTRQDEAAVAAAPVQAENHLIGNQLEELQTIMEAMVETIEDGFGSDPFKLSMAVLKTINLHSPLNRDTSKDEGTGILSLVNQEVGEEDKL